MATTRRRVSRSAHSSNLPTKHQWARAALSPKAKLAYAVIGTAGLSALAIAIFGPKRFQNEILKPAQNAVGDQASQLWADSRGLREQMGKLFARAQNEASREKLVRGFQSWVGHFKAT